jgi:hypothetical protein
VPRNKNKQQAKSKKPGTGLEEGDMDIEHGTGWG